MKTHSKSTLFLIEQLIVIAVFAICAVACINILTHAYFTARDASDTSQALIVAQNSAEIFRASNGDLRAVAALMGGIFNRGDTAEIQNSNPINIIQIYFDSNWQPTYDNISARFILQLERNSSDTESPNNSPTITQLKISKITGEPLISFPLTISSARNSQNN